MQPLTPELCIEHKLMFERNAVYAIWISALAHLPRDEAFGWMMVRMADENAKLRKLLEERLLMDGRHPLSDGDLLNWDGGTIVLEKPETKHG